MSNRIGVVVAVALFASLSASDEIHENKEIARSTCGERILPANGWREHCRFSNEFYPRIPSICKPATIHISLYHCCVEELDKDHLGRYRNLQSLRIQNNQLTSIHSHVFTNNSNLTELILSHNMISSDVISDGTFAGLAELEVLDLRHNLLSSLKRNMFKGCPNLKVLRLDWNRLTTTGNVFPPRLESLYLAHNRIESWTQHMTSLTRLNLNGNSLTSWTVEESRKIPNIRNLYLARNKISLIQPGSFHHNTNLVGIDVSNNTLTSLDKDIFQNLCHLKTVHMDDNFLHLAHPEWFAAIVKNYQPSTGGGRFIGLENNSWNCDCGFKSMQKFYVMLEQKDEYLVKGDWSRHLNIICQAPFQLKRQSLKAVDLTACGDSEVPRTFLSGSCRNEVPVPETEGSSFYLVVPASFGVLAALTLLIVCAFKRRREEQDDAQPPGPDLVPINDQDDVRVLNEPRYFNLQRPLTVNVFLQ